MQKIKLHKAIMFASSHRLGSSVFVVLHVHQRIIELETGLLCRQNQP